MRKNLVLATLAAAALVGCSKNENVGRNPDQAIRFENFVDNATKLVEGDEGTSNTTLQTIYVHGGKNADQFAGEQVTNNSGNWTYHNKKFWEAGETYRFAAYGPTQVDAPTFDHTNGHLTLTATADANNQVDYVYGEAQALNVTDPSTQGVVSFTMKHILSKLRFSFVKGADLGTNTRLEITNLTVEGATNEIKSKGTHVYDASSTSWGWNLADDAAKVTFTCADAITVTDKQNEGTPDMEEVGQAWYVIPQVVDGGITITFNVQLQQLASDGTTWENVGNAASNSGTISTANWVENNVYTYTATVALKNIQDGDGDDPRPIEFSASVDDWGQDNGEPVPFQ